MKVDWERSKALFAAALELSERERESFLQENCAGDDDLFREVSELLAEHSEAEGFLSGAAVDQFTDLAIADRPLLPAGKMLGQYEIERPLGRGGMGEVYLAKDPRLNRRVAVKLLPSTGIQNIKRFEQEVQTLSSLNHPNILTIFDFGYAGGERFMVSEFVDGMTLSDRLGNGALTIAECIEIGIQILAALGAAHEAGIIHRDIKPENIMIRRDGLVKVLDFGVAKLSGMQEAVDGQRAARLDPIRTNPGSLIGSVGYMSPEQAAGAEIDPRSDIFSLGVVLYEMIAGRRPFEGEGVAELIESTRTGPIVPLRVVRPDTPAELEEIVNGCLERERDKRLQTAREAIVQLRRVRFPSQPAYSGEYSFARAGSSTAHAGSDTSETMRESTPTVSTDPPRRSYAVRFAVASLLLLAVMGFDGFGYWMGEGEKEQARPVANEAYQSYLRGRFFWNKRTADDMKRAIAEFERALSIQPDYALAYVGLADCYTLLELYTGAPASETLPRAKEYALKAIALDGSSSEAHTALGYVYYTIWQWGDAERHLKRAVELGPDNPTAHHRYFLYLREMGRLDEASAMIARARELDPLSLVINLSHARAYLTRGDAATAVALTQKLTELYPNYAPGHTTLASGYIKQQRYAEAVEEAEKGAAIVRNGQTLSSLGLAKALAGDRESAEAVAAELTSRFERREVLAREVALVYVGLGQFDQVFKWLHVDLDNRSSELPAIVSMPDFQPIRGDERYKDIVRRMGLPDK